MTDNGSTVSKYKFRNTPPFCFEKSGHWYCIQNIQRLFQVLTMPCLFGTYVYLLFRLGRKSGITIGLDQSRGDRTWDYVRSGTDQISNIVSITIRGDEDEDPVYSKEFRPPFEHSRFG